MIIIFENKPTQVLPFPHQLLCTLCSEINSNINEIIRSVLTYKIISQAQKSTKQHLSSNINEVIKMI